MLMSIINQVSNFAHYVPHFLLIYKVHVTGGPVEEYARLIVEGACRGDPYVKYPSWYDLFFLYRVFAPKVLFWTFRFLLTNGGAGRTTSFIGTGKPLLEASSSSPLRRPGSPLVAEGSPGRLVATTTTYPQSFKQQRKFE